jgi:hypothetical protein
MEHIIGELAVTAYKQAARLLGTEHGTASLTPYVDPARPDGDYSRSPGGYTSYLRWEDGYRLILAALGIPPRHTGPADANMAPWAIGRAYTIAYDNARDMDTACPPLAPAHMAAWMRSLGIDDAKVRTGEDGTRVAAGTLPDELIAIVHPDATLPGAQTAFAHQCGHPDPDAGNPGPPMTGPLSVSFYFPAWDGGPLNEHLEIITGLDPATVMHDLASRL